MICFAGQKSHGFSVNIELDFVSVWVIEIDLISFWGLEIYMISEQESPTTKWGSKIFVFNVEVEYKLFLVS